MERGEDGCDLCLGDVAVKHITISGDPETYRVCELCPSELEAEGALITYLPESSDEDDDAFCGLCLADSTTTRVRVEGDLEPRDLCALCVQALAQQGMRVFADVNNHDGTADGNILNLAALTALSGVRLAHAEYHADFADVTRELTGIIWKLERSQHFREPNDASWCAFEAGEWKESLGF